MSKKSLYWIFFGVILSSIVLVSFFNGNSSHIELDSSIDLLSPNKTEIKSTSFKVEINKKGDYLIQNILVEKDSIEKEIIRYSKLENYETMLIKSHKSIEMHHVVFIMDIANRNKIKSMLAIKSE